MIVLNQDRINTKYFIEDNLIVDINTTRKLEELLTMMRNGEDIQTVASIHVYRTNESVNEKLYDRLEQRDLTRVLPDYYTLFDDDYDGDEDDWVLHDGSRPYIETKSDGLFTAYEQTSFGAKKTKYTFEEIPVQEEFLIAYIGDAVGIMPHFLTDESLKDETVQNLKKLSAAAEIGYNREIALSFPNEAKASLPPVTDAKMLQSLSNAERALFDDILHPARLTDAIAALKQQNPREMITKALVNAVSVNYDSSSSNEPLREHVDTSSIRYTAYKESRLGNSNAEEFLQKAKTAFEKKFHGHAPRVLKEYMLGQLLYEDYNSKNVKDSTLERIVDNFNQTSVQTIAAFKNPLLFAISDKLNFREVREDHISIFGAYLYPDAMSNFQTNGFIEWYKAHNDISPADLTKILVGLWDYPDVMFDKDTSIKDTVNMVQNQKGVEDCKEFEYEYNYSFKDNDLAIRGRNIVATQGDLKMYMLAADDYRNFTVGYDTHCCQHYGGAGSSCVWKLTTDPYAGVVVIERKGKILAQGFVWTDEAKDTLVFDNVEFADDRKVSQFNDLFAVWSQSMPYKNIHVGVGYNQGMQSWGRKVTYNATMPTTLSSGHVYSDYHNNARSLKKDGTIQITARGAVAISETPLVPSRFDTINNMGLGYLLSTGFSLDKMMEISEKLQTNTLTDEEIFDIIRSSKLDSIISHFDYLAPETQVWIMDNRPTAVEYINHPCPAVQAAAIAKDPSKIKDIEDPSEELQLAVIHQNGLLLQMIHNPTDRVIHEAVISNGMALKLVPQERQTEELQRIAVQNFPRIIISINNPSDTVYRQAIQQEPDIVGILGQLSDELQVFAVQCNPSVVNILKNPCAQAISDAVHQNGLLIRNFQMKYPFLREPAIRQNPFAIGAINNPTLEECTLALSLNPQVQSLIADAGLRTLAIETALAHAQELPQNITNPDYIQQEEYDV